MTPQGHVEATQAARLVALHVVLIFICPAPAMDARAWIVGNHGDGYQQRDGNDGA
jgi:hypothetical protein